MCPRQHIPQPVPTIYLTIYLPYTSTCTGLCPLQHIPIMIMVNGHGMCPPQLQHTPIIAMMLMAVMRSMIVNVHAAKLLPSYMVIRFLLGFLHVLHGKHIHELHVSFQPRRCYPTARSETSRQTGIPGSHLPPSLTTVGPDSSQTGRDFVRKMVFFQFVSLLNFNHVSLPMKSTSDSV